MISRAAWMAGGFALALTGCEQGLGQLGAPADAPAPGAAAGENATGESASRDSATGDSTTRETSGESATPAPDVTVQDELAATLPLPGEQPSIPLASNVPHVYMSLQPDEGSGPVSIVFAIDRSRDNSPEDDPAIRLTPEDGKCNPQEMRRFSFPDVTRQRPIFGPEEARRGITAKELPNFMAMMVTSEMMRQGLVIEPEASKPQNVCTRKLWQRMVVQQSTAEG